MPVPSSYNDVTVDKQIRDHVGLVWYDKSFFVPESWRQQGYRVWLRFGSVHYAAQVVSLCIQYDFFFFFHFYHFKKPECSNGQNLESTSDGLNHRLIILPDFAVSEFKTYRSYELYNS